MGSNTRIAGKSYALMTARNAALAVERRRAGKRRAATL